MSVKGSEDTARKISRSIYEKARDVARDIARPMPMSGAALDLQFLEKLNAQHAWIVSAECTFPALQYDAGHPRQLSSRVFRGIAEAIAS
jgi:hypothetical protein